ncbi:GNAT family N-acetyltransferase [Aquaticitalea lipolytica]|uniref:GNAT family N-acetyltransferase n=1 Tax=Aquaticitalea lipolytica TaxID=1247562 RepID=UPI0024B8EE86|nr:GNAT family N-acetyltransferase [Aquaticitalea lipolytica]
MNNNPFTSSTFEHIWIDHYCKRKKVVSIDGIKDVKFTKSKFFPIYVNLGKNFTNGMTYSISESISNFKNKVAIIYDVPNFFTVDYDEKSSIKLNKVRQYEAYYGNIGSIKSKDDILSTFFNSSKSKYNFKRNLRQFDETIPGNSYKVYFGHIDKSDYDREIKIFKELLSKRFDKISMFNTVLPMWDFYEELIYPLILEKKVVLSVVYNSNQPIALSINFLNDRMLTVSIRTFDIDYFKLNIGNIEIYKLIEWCIDNNIEIFDLSKGEGDYKMRWTTTEYFYDHHIIYDSKSITAVILGKLLIGHFQIKQYLRDQKINILYVKLKHIMKKLLFQK